MKVKPLEGYERLSKILRPTFNRMINGQGTHGCFRTKNYFTNSHWIIHKDYAPKWMLENANEFINGEKEDAVKEAINPMNRDNLFGVYATNTIQFEWDIPRLLLQDINQEEEIWVNAYYFNGIIQAKVGYGIQAEKFTNSQGDYYKIYFYPCWEDKKDNPRAAVMSILPQDSF